ncbi:phosphatidylserine decarboxylase [Sulfurimonas sp. SAG-AH-194-C21]|nr:phosphatidylserine decarboxylase [Sulfurimonas sp. SAG-AH-194-C21]MDF1883585.1 phosphatidylserine decarboxylase [Sulfurimonas sp. SAG-AH-194-C21]
MKTNLLPLAKEGISYFLYSLTFLVLFLFLDFDFLAFVTFLITLFIGYSFRNPERELSLFEPASFLSPVDGVMESIEELSNHEYAYKIEIQSFCRDVAILRVPANATVSNVVQKNGTRVARDSKLFRTLNENVELSFTTKEENTFKIIHNLAQSFTPLFVELQNKQKVFQTARYGLMLNGKTTVYLPQNFRVNISIGSELKASESLIGYFS